MRDTNKQKPEIKVECHPLVGFRRSCKWRFLALTVAEAEARIHHFQKHWKLLDVLPMLVTRPLEGRRLRVFGRSVREWTVFVFQLGQQKCPRGGVNVKQPGGCRYCWKANWVSASARTWTTCASRGNASMPHCCGCGVRHLGTESTRQMGDPFFCLVRLAVEDLNRQSPSDRSIM